MTDRDYTALDAAIANLNLEYICRFVPKRESRNKDQEEPSLNWAITLRYGGAVSSRELTTDYMQGIAHVPGYNQARTDYDKRMLANAASTGKYPVLDSRGMVTNGSVVGYQKTLPPPTLRDVLYSLVMDSDVLESSGFEEWASNLGYDTDSRKAEAIYKSCIEIALKFKALIGQENLDKLRELYIGY